MGTSNKRIAIARAIMYKELEKRKDARVIECKRRGLWTLWKYQTRYKTLWHFLRADNKRLLLLCDECIFMLLEKCDDYEHEIIYFEQRYKGDPCTENEEPLVYYKNLYNRCVRAWNEISILRNKLLGGNINEN